MIVGDRLAVQFFIGFVAVDYGVDIVGHATLREGMAQDVGNGFPVQSYHISLVVAHAAGDGLGRICTDENVHIPLEALIAGGVGRREGVAVDAGTFRYVIEGYGFARVALNGLDFDFTAEYVKCDFT